jgi:coxsackievirus/adenovirus receptor
MSDPDNGYQRDGVHPVYKGEVEIKRVFKGDDVVNQLASILVDPVRTHKMIMVEGFGDPSICENQVHVADTKIFLLNRNGYNGALKLNSSILPITLSNLAYTEAVVKGQLVFCLCVCLFLCLFVCVFVVFVFKTQNSPQ